MTDQAPILTPRQQNLALVGLAASVALIAIDITIVNVALPSIGDGLNASNAELQWVLDAFNVVMAGCVMLASGVGDRYGRKRIFLLGMALFALASAVAMMSPTITVLIGARALMGLAAATAMPATFSLLAVVFPPDRRPFAIGVWTAVGGVGLAAGPVLGGLLLQEFSWPAVFAVNIPIAILAIVAGAAFLPESKEVTGPHLDYLGAGLSLLALGGLVFGAIEGPVAGWTNPWILGAFAVGLASLVGFVRWELATASPMFEIRVLALPPVIAGAATVAMTYFASFTVLYLVPQFLQFVLDFSELSVGLALLPMGAVFGVLSPMNGKMIKLVGLRATLVSGLVVLALGLGVMAGLGHQGYLLVGVGLALIAIGWAGCLAPGTTVILDALPLRLAGSGSSVNQVSRQVGGALGVAVIGSVVSWMFRQSINALSLPDSVTQVANRSLGEAERVAEGLPEPISSELSARAVTAFDAAARFGLIVTAVLALLCAVVALVCLRGTAKGAAKGAAKGDETGEAELRARHKDAHIRASAHHFVGVGHWRDEGAARSPDGRKPDG